MNKRIILLSDFLDLLTKKHLLLDTSFFEDYAKYPEVFSEFVDQCKEKEIIFVTNVPVITEFTRGSRDTKIFNEKVALVHQIVEDYFLPINSNIFIKELPWLAEKYGELGNNTSTTDFILAAQTKLHGRDLCLVTKNPKDFPTSIFTVKTHFLLQLERALQVYGVYCYEEKKIKKPRKKKTETIPF